MGTMTNRNAWRENWILVLVALVVLVGFQSGLSDSQDIEQLRQEAEQGDAEAQFSLGWRYSVGSGVPKDDQEAVKWYRKAANQGLAKAQLSLGLQYATGEGVLEDDWEAVKWYRRAAEQGYADAQLYLGIQYATGEGVMQDFVKAYAWLNVVSAQGIPKAVRERDQLSEKMTPDQVAEAQKLSRELYNRIESAKSE